MYAIRSYYGVVVGVEGVKHVELVAPAPDDFHLSRLEDKVAEEGPGGNLFEEVRGIVFNRVFVEGELSLKLRVGPLPGKAELDRGSRGNGVGFVRGVGAEPGAGAYRCVAVELQLGRGRPGGTGAPVGGCRITSYNVCYTKLLRNKANGDRYEGSHQKDRNDHARAIQEVV